MASNPSVPELPIWKTTWAAYKAVLGDPKTFVRKAWAWIVIMVCITQLLRWLAPWIADGLAALIWIIELPMSAALAFAWHRHIQLREDTGAIRIIQIGQGQWRFMYRALLFSISVVLAAMVVVGVFMGIGLIARRMDIGTIPMLSMLACLPAIIVVASYVARFALAFPLTAIGEDRVFRRSWNLTKHRGFALACIATLAMGPFYGANFYYDKKIEPILDGGSAALMLPWDTLYWTVYAVSLCVLAGALSLTLLTLRPSQVESAEVTEPAPSADGAASA